MPEVTVQLVVLVVFLLLSAVVLGRQFFDEDFKKGGRE